MKRRLLRKEEDSDPMSVVSNLFVGCRRKVTME